MRKLSAYVAASSREIPRARAAMTALRLRGVAVTSSWVEAIEAAGSANEGLTHAQRVDAAYTCEAEVIRADVLLLLVPSEPSGIGCGWEAGYARGLGMRVVAAGRCERTVFASLVEEHATDGAAIDAIVARAEGRR